MMLGDPGASNPQSPVLSNGVGARTYGPVTLSEVAYLMSYKA